jgi:hypothetical protein
MTELKRWSSSESDVDPVLRVTMRYAREIKPTTEQVGMLLQATASRRAGAPKSFRRSLWGMAAVAAAFVSGAALAAYVVDSKSSQPPPQPALSVPRAVLTPPALPPASAATRAIAAPRPLEVPSVAPRKPISPTPSHLPAPLPSNAAPSVDQDALLLQEARAVMAQDPSRALTLTRDHELRYPTSALAEERQALRIEALARSGGREEAQRELQTFKARFPRSIYGRRLQGLVSP